MEIRNKRVLITGGSSGIGLALAQVLGSKGARVAISGRQNDRLHAAIASLRAAGVADAICSGLEENAFEVIRGGEARAQMIALNRNDPAALDRRFAGMKATLEEAVRDHSAL